MRKRIAAISVFLLTVTAGGGSAAARNLARKGFGIKISSDKYMEIYDGENPPVYFA